MTAASGNEATQGVNHNPAAAPEPHVAGTGSRETQILKEQVRLLYEQAPLGIFSTLLVAGVTAYVNLDTVPVALAAGWFLLHVVINGPRLVLVRAYDSRPRVGEEARRWGLWYAVGSGFSGLAWGCSVALLAFNESSSHQYFVAFMVGGMVSGAVGLLSAMLSAYLAYAVLALLPVAVWFLLQSSALYPLIGLLGVFLLGVMSLTARHLNYSLRRSLDLSLANAELAKSVSVAWDEAIKINRELEREIAARRRIENWLKEEKDRAQVTLQSIGDAVVTTDVHCRVDYLNPVAANLTGWSLGDAHNQPLEKVFRLRDEPAGSQRDDPVRHCLSEAVTHGFGEGMMLRTDAKDLPIQYSWAPIRDRDGELSGSVLVFREIGDHRSEQLSFEAGHDPLTGLMNRQGLEHRLQHAVETADSDHLQHVLVSLSVGDLEKVTRLGGDQAREELLGQFGRLLQRHVREADAVGRVDTDRFALLLESCSLESARDIVARLQADIDALRFPWQGESFAITTTSRMAVVSAQSEVAALLEP